MADSWMERKFKDLPTVPLFEEPERQPKPKPRRGPRSVKWAICPACHKRIGLYVLRAESAHRRTLAWRFHWRCRTGRDRFPCPTSDTEHTPPEDRELW